MDNRPSANPTATNGSATVAEIHEEEIMSWQNGLDKKTAGFDPTLASTLHHLFAASIISAGLWGIVVAVIGK